jgi:pyruvate,water dikinase
MRQKMMEYDALGRQMTQEHTPREWLDLAQQIHEATQPVAYFNIMIPMLGMMVHRVLSSQLKKQGHDTREVELAGVEAAVDQYSPHRHLLRLQQKYGSPDTVRSPETDAALESDLARFIDQFGHFSDSGNDCSSIPWRETPHLIRQMILKPPPEQKSDHSSIAFNDLRLPRNKRGLIRHIYHWASRFAVHREAISSLYTYGYGQFRRCYVGLGDALVLRGALAHREDVFYLYRQELVNLVDHEDWTSQSGLVSERRAAMDQVRDAVVPETIFGKEQPPVGSAIGNTLKGVATSLGHYTGPARILQGLSEIDRMQSGDVLVIPYSDVGWTPLFARAGAVVAESGGILSHSSIVAREYRIPAVVSVPGACRIPDGARVTVNGFSGEVRIEEVVL